MILPRNGRVIIIDDVRDQAIPLILALSKYNISTIFFDAQKQSLPITKIKDVRILFLDINLNGGQQPNWETEKAIIRKNITSIIEPKVPYILFVWSVNETDHIKDLRKLFDEELIDYKPIVDLIEMDKNSMFKLDIDDTGKEIWTLNFSPEETIELIKTKVDKGISDIDSIEALLKWEDIVNDSSALVVNDILRLANLKSNLQGDLKQIYYNLAHAYWGKTLTANPSETIAKSLVNLNSILSDKIEFKLSTEFKIELLKGFPDKPTFDLSINPHLNTKLLFTEDVTSQPIPGNLYVFENNPHKKTIIEDLIDRSKFGEEYCGEKGINRTDFYDGPDIKKEHKREFVSYCFKKIGEIVDEGVFMELELTPICDYSQGNRVFCRIVSGVILDNKYWSKKKNSATYLYISPMFLLGGKVVNFYCDFRYVKSVDIESLAGIKPILKIRHLFQSDIQSQLARQVSRPGIVSL